MTRQAMFARMVMRSVTRRRSRVLIAVLAVAIGATTLFALAAVAIDIPRQMSREMRAYGANLLVLPADGAASVPADRLPAVAAAVGSDGLIGWAPYRYQTVRLNAQPYLAAGTDLAAVQAVSPYWHVDGDWPARPGQVLVGADIADWIGLAPGDRVELTADDSAVMFDVAGILATGGSEDTLVLMALADLEALTGVAGHLDVVEFSVAADAQTIERLAAGVEAAVPGVVATPVKRLTQSDTYVLDMLQSLLGLIAVIVLALTMIGVSTTMIAVVAERRTEIALRKALGADNASVAREFLSEGLLLGAVGGILGTALGYGAAQVVSLNVFHRPVGFTWWLAVLSVAVSTLVAWAACLIPVRRAADVDPAVVLSGE